VSLLPVSEGVDGSVVPFEVTLAASAKDDAPFVSATDGETFAYTSKLRKPPLPSAPPVHTTVRGRFVRSGTEHAASEGAPTWNDAPLGSKSVTVNPPALSDGPPFVTVNV
jgi:hypothetical protein